MIVVLQLCFVLSVKGSHYLLGNLLKYLNEMMPSNCFRKYNEVGRSGVMGVEFLPRLAVVWLLFRLDDGYMYFFLYSFYFCVLFSLKMSIFKKKKRI